MSKEQVVLEVDNNWYCTSEFSGCVKFPSGYKAWYLNGERHRVDGPAVEYVDGRKRWCLNGKIIANNYGLLWICGDRIVLERNIPTDIMFGDLKITKAKLLTATGTVFVYDNLPGLDIGE